MKLYIYDSLGRGRVYAEYEMVYGKVYKQKLQQYAITKRIGNGQRMRARTLPVCTRPCFSPPATYKKQGLGTRLQLPLLNLYIDSTYGSSPCHPSLPFLHWLPFTHIPPFFHTHSNLPFLPLLPPTPERRAFLFLMYTCGCVCVHYIELR